LLFRITKSISFKIFPSTFEYKKSTTGELEVTTPRDLFTSENLKKFERPWNDKVPTAFFRGTATGGGVTVETNQRLHLAHLSHLWNKQAEIDMRPADEAPYLDAKIVGWNCRDKKIATGKMTFVDHRKFEFDGDREKNFVPIYEQSKYKYVIYAEGHCAACRYAFMMQLGSVILKVDSTCVADKLWYFPLLQPNIDHIPIKADLSDLKEKIDWCRSNDRECERIAANAKRLYYQYISKDGILDYMQAICIEISKRWVYTPSWAVKTDYESPRLRPCPQFSATTEHGKPRYCEV